MSRAWSERRRQELAAELEQIAAEKSAWWDALRHANENQDTAEYRRLLATSAELDDRIERLRKVYFPRRGRLAVIADDTIGQAAEAFTTSPRGRSVRTVWSARDGVAA